MTRRQSGFTLIELMVVLAIAAILSALVLGGFRQISASNRRQNCQVNLSQIYTALKMYAQDEPNNKFPDFDPKFANNMGLWKLYTVQVDPADPARPIANGTSQFPSALLYNGNRKITGMYLRSYKNLHCPSDEDKSDIDDDGDPLTPLVSVANDQLFTNSTNKRFNQNYLSYQGYDAGGPNFRGNAAYFPTPPPNEPPGVSTYLPRRTTDLSDKDWGRQLMPSLPVTSPALTNDVVEKQPAPNTVVTWCRHHRSGLGGRDSDIVLFYDGSIQTIAQQQNNPSGPPLMTWRRKAKTSDF